MSLALFESDNEKRVDQTPLSQQSEPGAFDGFVRGSAAYTMRGFAEAGRAISMAGSVVPVFYDKFNNGTEASDRYFKWHDEVFGNAVDYWTPKPGEVGVAGQVVGSLLSTLPLVIASPALAVAKTQLSTAEDLVRGGVEASKAQQVGALQGASLGFGIWLPILGKNLWQRVLVGGLAANVVQGAVTRGISGQILEGTPAEGQFKAFDREQLTLDALLGLAFGTLAHISPAQRQQGAEYWKRIESWAGRLKAEDVDAVMTLRQAQHLNVDSMPGKPVDVADIDAHVGRVRKALEQLARDEPVNVDDMPAPRFKQDRAQMAANKARLKDMTAEAERIRVEEGLPELPKPPKAVAETDQGVLGAIKRGAKKVAEVLTKEDQTPDPLTTAAREFAKENPDLNMRVGEDADGNPVTKKVGQLLDEADANVKEAGDTAKLFRVAAACLLGLA